MKNQASQINRITAILTIIIPLVFTSCKKKETPVEEPAPAVAPATTPTVDYRDKFTGKYAVTFTTVGSPAIVQSNTVVLRYAVTSEAPSYLNYMPVNIFVTIDSLPFDYVICFPIDTAGKCTDSGKVIELGGGKFNSWWKEGLEKNSKLILGAGTKLP